MTPSPAARRILVLVLVAIGFLAQVIGIRMMSAGGSPNLALSIMGVGVVLVVGGMVLRSGSRGSE